MIKNLDCRYCDHLMSRAPTAVAQYSVCSCLGSQLVRRLQRALESSSSSSRHQGTCATARPVPPTTMAVDTSTSSECTENPKDQVRKPLPIRAWRYNPTDDPPSQPHQYSPNQEVSTDHLQRLGVLIWTDIETENFENNKFLNKIKSARGYNYEEALTVSPGKLPNFEQNTKKFFKEHLHDHEEIRFILDGVGYEDVRDFDGSWIRIEIKKGDLFVLPPGMYHRFTLGQDQYLKALLLYQGTPTRIQFEKAAETDVMEVRLDYVQSVLEPEGHAAAEAEDAVLHATTIAVGAITV